MVRWLRYKFKSINMLLKFFKVVWNFRGWDYSYNLELLKKSLEITIESNKKASIKHEGQEESIKQMERAVELLNNLLEDDYSSQFGYIYDENSFNFKKIEGRDLYELENNSSEEVKENNRKAIKLGEEQCEKDWNELFTILKKHLREWWW